MSRQRGCALVLLTLFMCVGCHGRFGYEPIVPQNATHLNAVEQGIVDSAEPRSYYLKITAVYQRPTAKNGIDLMQCPWDSLPLERSRQQLTVFARLECGSLKARRLAGELRDDNLVPVFSLVAERGARECTVKGGEVTLALPPPYRRDDECSMNLVYLDKFDFAWDADKLLDSIGKVAKATSPEGGMTLMLAEGQLDAISGSVQGLVTAEFSHQLENHFSARVQPEPGTAVQDYVLPLWYQPKEGEPKQPAGSIVFRMRPVPTRFKVDHWLANGLPDYSRVDAVRIPELTRAGNPMSLLTVIADARRAMAGAGTDRDRVEREIRRLREDLSDYDLLLHEEAFCVYKALTSVQGFGESERMTIFESASDLYPVLKVHGIEVRPSEGELTPLVWNSGVVNYLLDVSAYLERDPAERSPRQCAAAFHSGSVVEVRDYLGLGEGVPGGDVPAEDMAGVFAALYAEQPGMRCFFSTEKQTPAGGIVADDLGMGVRYNTYALFRDKNLGFVRAMFDIREDATSRLGIRRLELMPARAEEDLMVRAWFDTQPGERCGMLLDSLAELRDPAEKEEAEANATDPGEGGEPAEGE